MPNGVVRSAFGDADGVDATAGDSMENAGSLEGIDGHYGLECGVDANGKVSAECVGRFEGIGGRDSLGPSVLGRALCGSIWGLVNAANSTRCSS